MSLPGVIKAIEEGAKTADAGYNLLGYVASKQRNCMLNSKLMEMCLYLVRHYPLLLTETCAKKMLKIRDAKFTGGIIFSLHADHPTIAKKIFEDAVAFDWSFRQDKIAHLGNNFGGDPLYEYGDIPIGKSIIDEERVHPIGQAILCRTLWVAIYMVGHRDRKRIATGRDRDFCGKGIGIEQDGMILTLG